MVLLDLDTFLVTPIIDQTRPKTQVGLGAITKQDIVKLSSFGSILLLRNSSKSSGLKTKETKKSHKTPKPKGEKVS